jgi:hypothetical protein
MPSQLRPCTAIYELNRSPRTAVMSVVLFVCVSLARTSLAQTTSASSSNETFTISGTVVNSVTGEPIARALVRTNGTAQHAVFTDSAGHFQINGLPAVQASLLAQKPGYSIPHDGPGSLSDWFQIGPDTTSLTVKLIPEGAIYGRVTDSSGQAIEHIPLRLTCRTLREGRKRWEQRGMMETFEDGHFRFANLMPGTYYLAAGPLAAELQILIAGDKPKTGFAHAYYPGAPDLTSAVPIQLSAGQQAETDFSLNAVPMYELSGTVSGNLPEQGVGFQLLTLSGDDISLPTNFNMEAGTFKLQGVPAGSYIVRAISQAGLQPMRAEARVNVASNIEDLRLTLTPAVSIPIVVRLDSRSSSTTSSHQDRPPISVRLLPAAANNTDSFSTFQRSGSSRSAMVLQNVEPGTYTADLMPLPPWYVQSATYGPTNLLYDDITLAPGQSYSMDIVLRDDAASLSGAVKSSDGNLAPAIVVIVPQPAGKIAPHVVKGVSNRFHVDALAPGEYLIFALDDLGDLEYANADAFAPYASQAAHVTLVPGQQAQVSLDLIHTGAGD